jgi:hypothetical protein
MLWLFIGADLVLAAAVFWAIELDIKALEAANKASSFTKKKVLHVFPLIVISRDDLKNKIVDKIEKNDKKRAQSGGKHRYVHP